MPYIICVDYKNNNTFPIVRWMKIEMIGKINDNWIEKLEKKIKDSVYLFIYWYNKNEQIVF